MKKIFIFVLAFLTGAGVSAQEKAVRPLDVPMSFSGTYGELRHDHFHSGVDWRVGGKVGDPIYAIKSGYVSRVSVSPWGYGNGIYIVHPDGTTSVYGHLLSFREDIARRVKQEQYSKETFSVNLHFGPDEFPVLRGDMIGKVGNSGSSAGPHLHMEIRDTESDLSLNYISMGVYALQDKIPPQFHRVCFYGLDDSPVPRIRRIHNLVNPNSVRDTIKLPGRSYVAIDATDRQEGTTARLAVEEYRVLLDDTLVFSFKVGDVPSSEGRYIKSLIQYDESRRGGRDLVKSKVDPNNMLASRISCRDGGLILLNDDSVHSLSLEAIDEHGNRAVLRYRICRDDSIAVPEADSSRNSTVWLWYTRNMVSDSTMTYMLPAGSLYDNINFTYRKIGGPDASRNICSEIWEIGDPDIPLHFPGALEIAAEVPEYLEDKAYIANYGKTLSHAGVNVRFGTYCVAIDTIAPSIRFLGGKNGIVSGGKIRILVRDEASGLESARVEIDGKWYLSMLKRDIVSLELDEERLGRGVHTISVFVTDICGNEACESRKFTF